MYIYLHGISYYFFAVSGSAWYFSLPYFSFAHFSDQDIELPWENVLKNN